MIISLHIFIQNLPTLFNRLFTIYNIFLEISITFIYYIRYSELILKFVLNKQYDVCAWRIYLYFQIFFYEFVAIK